jgi:two-component system chemotaxis response regulator CheB
MPAVFTKLLAERLSKQCGIEVFEGRTGIAVRAGRAIIAAGGSHMGVVRRNGVVEIETNMGPAENSCRPAVDVLFRSVASVYGAKSLGVVLTGMGSDGLRGCAHMREAGSEIVVQDEATSVVWGMPGFVAKAGLADRVLPLHEIAGELERRAWMGRGTDRGIGRGSVAC